MNPELQRNIWLNISTSRLIAMPLILFTILWAVSVSSGIFYEEGRTFVEGAQGVARDLFFLIVVVWGTWLSSRAVVGEIRDRTWDGQRMSAIEPWSMVWGKLFGSTVFVWYGGLICLAVILAYEVQANGLGAAGQTAVRMVSVGVFAQATALLASLLAVRRHSRHLGSQIIGYQVVGILAGLGIEALWRAEAVDQLSMLSWFGFEMHTHTFLLASIVLFMVWVMIGCYRMMRQELQYQAGPLVWICFLVFAIAYFAGLADAVRANAASSGGRLAGLSESELLTFRIMIAVVVSVFLTYAMLFWDAKDMVQFRRAASRFLHGRFLGAFALFPSYIYAAIAAIGFSIVLVFRTAPIAVMEGIEVDVAFVPMIIAGMFFLIRDVALVVGLNAGRIAHRGDFAAAIFLILLYGILPFAVLVASGWNRELLVFFTPFSDGPAAAVIAIPALEALMVTVWALSRVRARNKET